VNRSVAITQNPEHNLSPYALLGVMWCIWLMVFVFRTLLSPLLPLIELEYGISHGQSSLLITAMSLTYAAVHLPAGMLAVRFGLRRSVVTSMLVAALCAVLVFVAPGFWWMILAVSVLGIGLGMYFPSAVALLSRVFPPSRVGRVIGIHETASQTGIIVGSIAAGTLAPLLGWKEIFIVCIVPVLILAVAFVLASRRTAVQPVERPQRPMEPRPGTGSIQTVLASGELRSQLFPYTMNVLAAHGLAPMIPLFLVVVHGLGVAEAAYIFAFTRVGSIFGSYAGGSLSDRFGRRNTQATMIGLTTLTCAGMALLPWGVAVIAVLVVFSFTSIAYYVATFAEISESVTPRLRSVGLGLYGTVGGVVSGFAPFVVGTLADVVDFRFALAFPTTCAALGLVVLLWGMRGGR